MKDIPVVILAGGLGMRIREETEFKPKPMIMIGERPILWHIMKLYATQGFQRFIVCIGYKGEIIKDYFLNYRLRHVDFTVNIGRKNHVTIEDKRREDEWSITLAETGATAMTGARIKKIQRYVKDQVFMATYGDGLADIDIKALLAFHRSHGKIATVTGVNPPSRFGELLLKGEKVKEFQEKPPLDTHYVNGGFFVFSPKIFNYLTADDGCTLEKDPLQRLAKDGQLMSYSHKGFWQCMDTVRDMNLLNDLWKQDDAPWKVWDR